MIIAIAVEEGSKTTALQEQVIFVSWIVGKRRQVQFVVWITSHTGRDAISTKLFARENKFDCNIGGNAQNVS